MQTPKVDHGGDQNMYLYVYVHVYVEYVMKCNAVQCGEGLGSVL